jgi:hypothetical protein
VELTKVVLADLVESDPWRITGGILAVLGEMRIWRQTDAFMEKHFWMRRLAVVLQKGIAMTFDAYCEWRNSRDLQVQGQVGFLAKRQAAEASATGQMRSCLAPGCCVSTIWLVRVHEVSKVRLHGDFDILGLRYSFPSFTIKYLGWCNLHSGAAQC